MGISRAAPPNPLKGPRVKFKKPNATRPVRTFEDLAQSIGAGSRSVALADLQPEREILPQGSPRIKRAITR